MRVLPATIIKTYLAHKKHVAKTARVLGIHRATVYRWIKRARSLSWGKLKQHRVYRHSTKPIRPHTVLTPAQSDAIVQLRRKTGWTAVKIRHKLKVSVGVNTIHRLLKRKQLLNQYHNHRRPRYQQTTHMHLSNTTTLGYLQMDVKYLTPQLTGLPWTCFEYGVIDIFSRYKEAVILNHLDEDGAIAALLEIIPKLPFIPTFLQTDNGLEFQKRFHLFVQAQSMKHHYVHKSTPNENAVIERSFRTDEEEFFFFKYNGAADYDDLRGQFAAFLHFYNRERPHLGINLQTPLEVVAHVVGD